MYKASISDFIEIRAMLYSILQANMGDTKTKYGVNKMIERITKNPEIANFLDKAMDKKIELAKEKDGIILRDSNGEPEIKPEKRNEYREWFRSESEKLIEIEPYIISCEYFKEDVFLIEKLNGLLFSVNIDSLLEEKK